MGLEPDRTQLKFQLCHLLTVSSKASHLSIFCGPPGKGEEKRGINGVMFIAPTTTLGPVWDTWGGWFIISV